MTTQRTAVKAAVAAVAAAAAFSVVSAPPAAASAAAGDRGNLRVVAQGVPEGRAAKIVVAGKKFRKKVPRAGLLRNLRPGTYRVWATPIVAGGGTAAVPDLPVRVRVPKRKKATLRLQYQWNPRTDVYPPGPVTGLAVTARNATSIALRWTNSQAPDLHGVAVRRKVGTVAPTGLDDGRVVEVDRGAQVLSDGGLRQYTTYSYSVFMVDTAGNASAAASVTVSTTGRAAQVVSGLEHSCALLPEDDRDGVGQSEVPGRVVCWGANSRGQLGTGATRDAGIPVAVDLDDVVQISAGSEHTCARLADGAVWCWGRNDQGQLGIGSTDDALRPSRVVMPQAAWVAAGGEHTCAVGASGALRCWGADDSGQTGQRAGEPVLAPPETAVLTNVTSVAAGWAHTCAIRAGAVRCFGQNDQGQLGSGSTAPAATPVAVSGLSRPAVQVSAGVDHTCAVLSDGALSCWGGNSVGQVGDGTTAPRLVPQPVLSDVTAVSAGAYHTCAATGNATMRCWGRNAAGRLGEGTDSDRFAPTRVLVASGVSSVAAGGYHSCAVSGPDTYCWGAGARGQLGTAGFGGSLRPLPVAGL